MSQGGSVSHWIGRLKNGKDSAARNIWQRYRGRLQSLAGYELGNSPRAVSDDEDVVIRAFEAFLRRTREGAYGNMQTRDDLWRLLVAITRSYARKQSRFLGRLRRRMIVKDPQANEEILRQLASDDPTPDVLASVSESLRMLIDKLQDPDLQEVAMGRLNGLTNEEIAAQQNRSVRTIERRLGLIRIVWNEHVAK